MTDHVGNVSVGEDGHRHEWRLVTAGDTITRQGVSVTEITLDTWYCVHCRLVVKQDKPS